jgi:short-subunit dehydrogenase
MNIWIIGASYGMGAELAKQLAGQGATLALSARSAEALNDLNQQLGGKHVVLPFDVADSVAAKNAATTLQQQWTQLDSVIFMAALYTPMKFGALDLSETQKIITVNIGGAFNLVEAALPWLKQQGRGQLALCASVAGYNGLPYSQPYAATKAAMLNMAESLYVEMAGTGIDVRVICPGFVRTRLTEKNDFPMPFAMSTEAAVARIIKGLQGKSYEVHFPKRLSVFLKVLRVLPFFVRSRILKRLV